jgi:hypothetical protein
MCPTYTTSRGDIQRFGGAQYVVSNPRVEELRGDHINATTMQELGRLALDTNELEARHVAGLKFHQHVDITLWTEILAKDGTEQRQPDDVMPSTEGRDGLAVDGDLWTHGSVHDTAGHGGGFLGG